uniref:Uncharacterized protein n=1 Tax=Octopus bimaculoides TaxID=37653 RepID=A0A0L8GJ77_OCTBM
MGVGDRVVNPSKPTGPRTNTKRQNTACDGGRAETQVLLMWAISPLHNLLPTGSKRHKPPTSKRDTRTKPTQNIQAFPPPTQTAKFIQLKEDISTTMAADTSTVLNPVLETIAPPTEGGLHSTQPVSILRKTTPKKDSQNPKDLPSTELDPTDNKFYIIYSFTCFSHLTVAMLEHRL